MNEEVDVEFLKIAQEYLEELDLAERNRMEELKKDLKKFSEIRVNVSTKPVNINEIYDRDIITLYRDTR